MLLKLSTFFFFSTNIWKKSFIYICLYIIFIFYVYRIHLKILVLPLEFPFGD